jgi:hypothetical protein
MTSSTKPFTITTIREEGVAMTETRPYDNSATQAERKAVLRNDTYFARQSNTVDDAGGRFAKLTPSNLTGQSYQVPRLPENSPWHSDPVPATEPLGFSVDAMEPNGTPEEVKASIAALKPPEVRLPASVEDHAAEPAASVVSPLSTQATGSSIKRRRSW